MKIITIAIQKGGVGKTTITSNLAGAYAEAGKRVLMIDLDLQMNLTSIYAEEGYGEHGIGTGVAQQIPLKELIQETAIPNLYLLPADENLKTVDLEFGKTEDQESLLYLKDGLKKVSRRFDIVLCDTPLFLGFPTRMALIASHGWIVPFHARLFERDGLLAIQREAEYVKKTYNPRLKFLGIAVNKAEPGKRRLTDTMLRAIEDEFGDKLLKTQIKQSVKYEEAAALGKPITHYKKHSRQAKAFRKLAREINL